MTIDPNEEKSDDEFGKTPEFDIDLDATPTLEEAHKLHEKMRPLFLTIDDLQSLLSMIEQGQKDQWINGRRVVSALQNIEQMIDPAQKLTIIIKFIPMMSTHLQEYEKSDYIGHGADKKRQFFLTAIQIGKNIIDKAQGEAAEADTEESTMEMKLDSYIDRIIADDVFHPEIAPCKNGSAIYGIDKGVPKYSSDGSENNRPNEDGMYINTKEQFFLSADGMGGHGQGDLAVRTSLAVVQDAMNGTLPQEELDMLKNPKEFVEQQFPKKSTFMASRAFKTNLPKLGPHKLTMEQIQYLCYRRMCETFLSHPYQDNTGISYNPGDYQKIKELNDDTALAQFYEKNEYMLKPGLCYIAAHVGKNYIDIYGAGDVRAIIVGSNGKVRHATEDEGMKNIVTNAVIASRSGSTTYQRFPLQPGDRVVICSDGATDNFEGSAKEVNNQIAQIVHGKSLYSAETELYNHCKKSMERSYKLTEILTPILYQVLEIKNRLMDKSVGDIKESFAEEAIPYIRQTIESAILQTRDPNLRNPFNTIHDHADEIASALFNGNSIPSKFIIGKPDNINIIIYDHKG